METVKKYFIKEEDYRKIKQEMDKEDDYFTQQELEYIYKKIDVILT